MTERFSAGSLDQPPDTFDGGAVPTGVHTGPADESHDAARTDDADLTRRDRRSPLRVVAFVISMVVLFGVVASASALVVMARRGQVELPWKKPSGPTTSPATPAPDGGSRAPAPRASGSLGEARKENPPTGGGAVRPDLFESSLGYRTRLPVGWQVLQRAQPETGDAASDSFSNGRDGLDFAAIQVLALQAPGLDALQVASQVATKASAQQGFAIMVQPHKTSLARFEAAAFRAYAVQNGFPLVVEVYVVPAPEGKFLQIQFSSSLEAFTEQSGAVTAFAEDLEFATG